MELMTLAFIIQTSTLLCMALCVSSCGPNPNSLPVKTRLVKAGVSGCERVVGYAINLGEKHPAPNKSMLINGHLNPSRTPKAGVALTDQQISRLLDATIDFNYTGPVAACFEPRHGFVFSRADGTIAAEFTICFHCRGFHSTGGRFSDAPDYESLERLVQDLGLPLK